MARQGDGRGLRGADRRRVDRGRAGLGWRKARAAGQKAGRAARASAQASSPVALCGAGSSGPDQPVPGAWPGLGGVGRAGGRVVVWGSSSDVRAALAQTRRPAVSLPTPSPAPGHLSPPPRIQLAQHGSVVALALLCDPSACVSQYGVPDPLPSPPPAPLDRTTSCASLAAPSTPSATTYPSASRGQLGLHLQGPRR